MGFRAGLERAGVGVLSGVLSGVRGGLRAALPLLLVGCATVGHMQTPDTAGKGKVEFAVEPSYYQRSMGVSDDVVIPSVSTTRKIIVDGQDLNEVLGLEQGVPNLSGAIRYGIADSVDVGVRWGANGVDLLGKVRLTPASLDTVVVSVIPSMGGMYLPLEKGDLSMLNMQLGMLVGMKLGKRNQLVFGPKVQSWQARGVVDSVDVKGSYVAAGGSVGVAIRLSDSVRLLPELSLAAPISWKIRAENAGEIFQTTELPEGQQLLFQGGIAVLLGRKKAEISPPASP